MDLNILPVIGPGVVLQCLRFKVKNHGKKVIDFIYDVEDESFTLGLQIDLDGRLNLKYSIREEIDSYSVVQVFRYYEFFEALSRGGKFEILDSMSKLRILGTDVPAGVAGEIDPYLVELYRKAAFIQMKMNRRLTVPKTGLHQQDVLDIEELHEILINGRINRITGTLSVIVNDGKVPVGLEASMEKKEVNLQFTSSHTYEILGETVDIGEVQYFIREAIIVHEIERGKVKKIRFEITAESPGIATYLSYANTV